MESSSPSRVWLNSSLPQTLYIAHILLYIQGGMGVLSIYLFGFEMFSGTILTVVLTTQLMLEGPGKIAAAFGIANQRPWGYKLGIATATAPILLRLIFTTYTSNPRLLVASPISLMFDIALLALLLHVQSRGHANNWQ